MHHDINAADYGLDPHEDATPALRRALQACREKKVDRLLIPPGTYHLYPDLAVEEYCFISNHDHGLKRISAWIEGFKDFTLDGQGAHFICHGVMIPFFVRNSSRIKLMNFRIDWALPFFFQGEVIVSNKESKSFDIRVLEECIYEIRRDELIFRGKRAEHVDHWKEWPAKRTSELTWEQNGHWHMWFDGRTKQPWPREERYRLEPQPRVEEVGPHTLRLYGALDQLPEPGMVLIWKGKKEPNRTSPAIVLDRSRDIVLEKVTVHHAGGMGLIAQRCENVLLTQFAVVLPEGSSRLCTTTADATHFNGCRGSIQFEDCKFENMLDDATNVHGTYVHVERVLDPHTILCRFMHSQQVGFPFVEAGDVVRLFQREHLQPYASLEVKSKRVWNAAYFELTLQEPVADVLLPDTVLDNESWQPEVTMRRCMVRNHRARSVLLQTGHSVVLEQNRFEHSSYAGIQFEGDTELWWEAGKVEDVVIRGNQFVDIQGPVISIVPRMPASQNRYHRNITVEENTIEAVERCLVRVHAVEGFSFLRNSIRYSSEDKREEPVFHFTASSGIRIEGNRYQAKQPAEIQADSWTVTPVVRDNQGF